MYTKLCQGRIQRNHISDIWAVNLQFRWDRDANSGLHVVYSYSDFAFFDGPRKHQEFAVKYSHLFDVAK